MYIFIIIHIYKSQAGMPASNMAFKGMRFCFGYLSLVNDFLVLYIFFSMETAICFYDVCLPSILRLVDWFLNGLMDHTRHMSHFPGNWEDNTDIWEKYQNIPLQVILYFGFISPIINYTNHLPGKTWLSVAVKWLCADNFQVPFPKNEGVETIRHVVQTFPSLIDRVAKGPWHICLDLFPIVNRWKLCYLKNSRSWYLAIIQS